MKIKEFFKNTKKVLGVNSPNKDEGNKRERLESLLIKLQSNIDVISKKLADGNLENEKKDNLKEEIHIYKLQIKKGKEILLKQLNNYKK